MVSALLIVAVFGSDFVVTERPRTDFVIAAVERDRPREGSPFVVTQLPQEFSTKADKLLAPAKPKATGQVCQCRGTNHAVCLCLKAGVKCHCTANSGSEWFAAKKVGRVDLTTGKPAQGSPTPTMVPRGQGYAVTINGNWMWWTVDGMQLNNLGWGVVEGTLYGGRWLYRGGQMFDQQRTQPATAAPQMAAVQPSTVASTERWEWRKVCHGTYCTFEKVRVQ